jgi:hypothetical protein
MRCLLLAAIILTAPVQAADFGALDFGSPCDSIRALEEERNRCPPLTRSKMKRSCLRGRAERDVSLLPVSTVALPEPFLSRRVPGQQ